MNWEIIKNYPAFLCTTKDSDRTDSALNEISKTGIINLTNIYGIDARTDNGEEEIKGIVNDRNIDISLFKSYGEIALTLAFLSSLEQFLETQNTHMLWFEDDVIIHPNFNTIKHDINNIKNFENYNLIYLGSGIAHKRNETVDLIKNNINFVDTTNSLVWGTHALLIDRIAATQFLEQSKLQVIDLHICNVCKKSKILKSAALLYALPLNDTDQQNYIFKQHLIEKKWPDYRVAFFSDTPIFGLFFQRRVKSILQTQKKFI